ncbi:hypothetical protein HZC30_03875 [Candidatus Woesearchaeota archaeon]|nr:hypothetical protein [Candidatus Woesearchaeota archaeon]
MGINFDELKTKVNDTIARMREKYAQRIDDAYVLRQQGKVAEGIKKVRELQELVGVVSSKTEYGRRVMDGVIALAHREQGNPQEGDKESLETLASAYYSRHSFLARAYRRLRGKPIVSIDEGLSILHETVSMLPGYVDRLHRELKEQEGGMRGLKTGLRGNVEMIIQEKPQLAQDREELYQKIEPLKAQYHELESVREQNSSQGRTTEAQVLSQLEQLELLLDQAQEAYTELATQEKRAQNNVDMLNSQIKKVDQYLILLSGTKEIVTDATNYVNVQVPFVKGEIESQKAEIRALSGVNGVIDFLEGQKVVSREINAKIKSASSYLAQKVEEVRKRDLEAPSIYPLLPAPEPKKKLMAE